MTAAKAPRVHHVEDVGWLVTHEDDPRRARLLVIAELMSTTNPATGHYPRHLSGYHGPNQKPHLSEWWLDPDVLEPIPLTDVEPGWYRVNPCTPDCGEHGWHYDDAPGPGRGNFRGSLVRTVHG